MGKRADNNGSVQSLKNPHTSLFQYLSGSAFERMTQASVHMMTEMLQTSIVLSHKPYWKATKQIGCWTSEMILPLRFFVLTDEL